MSAPTPLDPFLESPVQNVYLYIGDAVRWDSVPDRLLEQGLAIKSVAAGIHSPTSIASIVSGTGLSQHGVEDFTDQLPVEVPNLLDLDGVTTRFMNTINDVRFDSGNSESIIATTLRTSDSEPSALDTVSPPFFALERGPGGHAPYVRDAGLATGKAYFESRGDANQSQFRQEYDQAVAEDVDWFLSRVETLAERGLLEETLIIYVSDHGELLGEGGALAHSPPIHPKHVYVPTVYIHPRLSTGVIRDWVVRHVDLAPTIMSLLDVSPTVGVDPAGRTLTTEPLAARGVTRYQNTRQVGPASLTLQFDSVWDTNGGYVVPESGPLSQLLLAGHRLAKMPWRAYARDNLASYLYFYLRGTRCHGTPAFTRSTARDHIAETRAATSAVAGENEIDVPTDRLKELGYIE